MDLFKRIMNSKKEDEPAVAAGGAQPQHLTGEQFNDIVLKSEVPVVVDFWAEWCGPCHAIAPSVARLAQEFDGRAVVGKVNADDFPEILSRFGIMGIPTLIFFQAGQERDRVVGVTTYGALKGKLERMLG